MATPQSPRSFGPRRYTYEALAEATDRFSNKNHLGEGGFGQVFKGSLHDQTFAIKKLRIVPDQETREEMEREIRLISDISHINLVKLFGYCVEGANALLVLEYFSYGSLKINLHDKDILDWPKRMKIALGTAKGLEYLHGYCNSKIIHQDIKPDNILLDSNFESKIADFGLALKFPDPRVSHISRSIMGTDVYVDPEDPKRVSDKSDVYSYGVVLLELITGRKPKYQDIDIVNWAKNRIKQALEEEYRGFVDARLQRFDKIEMKRMVYCAEACVYSRPQLRPSMEKIVLALKGYMSLKDLRGSTENDTELPHSTMNKGISSSSTERFQRIFTYQELTIATEGFSGNNLVARSSHCQVYRGYLNGETVTVKKYNYMPGKKEDVFDHIKSISSSVHHNNLVNLLGFCNEGPNRLLVYEFVSEDKSLRSHLHGNVTSTLDWPIRMGIALSIARGMVDLHELYKPLNIYEQYKDDSIFLDGNFQPKFAEYGHGRFLPGAFGGHSLTVNYAKADVYLFGEILMELITGKPSNEDGVNIAEWAEPVLGMALLRKEYDIVDQKLKNEFNEIELIRMIKCALACVHRYAHFRPQMSQIAEVLAGNAPPETLK